MLSRKGGGLAGPRAPTANHEVVELGDMCVLLIAQHSSPHTTQHYTEGPDTGCVS